MSLRKGVEITVLFLWRLVRDSVVVVVDFRSALRVNSRWRYAIQLLHL